MVAMNASWSYGNSTYREELFSPIVTKSLTALYIIVTVTGFVSNTAVIIAFITKRVRIAPFTLLLLNLSIADLVQDINLQPYIFIKLHKLPSYVTQHQGNILCSVHIGLTPFWMAAYTSVFTLTLISLFRYASLIPLSSSVKLTFTTLKIKCCIAALWLSSIAMFGLHFISFRLDRHFGLCYREWPGYINGPVYVLVTAVVGFIAPSAALIFNCISSIKFLWQKGTKNTASVVRQQERKRIITLYLALIGSFFLCWTPMFVYIVLARTTYFTPGPSGEFEKERFLRVVILIAGCNSVCDPALYAFCGKSFRTGFLHNTGHYSQGSKNSRFTKSLSKKDRLSTKREDSPPRRGSIATITTLDL